MVCNGTDAELPEVVPSCPWLSLIYTKVTDGNARYQINVTTAIFRADKVFLKIRFDVPVDNIFVS